MKNRKTLSVSAIKTGTVIDHIPCNEALKILRFLDIKETKPPITLGLYLDSDTMGQKDILKIENRIITEEEAGEIAIFAPTATINIIQNYLVAKKFKPLFPQNARGLFRCPNERCITNDESISTHFLLKSHPKEVELTCKYCQKDFKWDEIKDFAK